MLKMKVSLSSNKKVRGKGNELKFPLNTFQPAMDSFRYFPELSSLHINEKMRLKNTLQIFLQITRKYNIKSFSYRCG